MREVKTLLYGPAPLDTDRSTTVTLNDDIDKYDLLRVYLGFSTDGFTVIEIDLSDRNYASIINFWTFYGGSASKTAIGSLRWNDFRLNNSKRNLPIHRTLLTYLQAGTSAYTNNTNSVWGPKPIYKIVGVKFVR